MFHGGQPLIDARLMDTETKKYTVRGANLICNVFKAVCDAAVRSALIVFFALLMIFVLIVLVTGDAVFFIFRGRKN